MLPAWFLKNPAALGQHFPAIHGGSAKSRASRTYQLWLWSGPTLLKHLNHTFTFGHQHEAPPGASREATHELTKHAVLLTQCKVEDVQLADAEKRSQKRRLTLLLWHTLLLLQRQAASGRSARRYRAAGCPHLEQGWPLGS